MKTNPVRRFWVVLTVVVALFTAAVIGRNLLHIWKVSGEIADLREEAERYQQSIESDSTLLERLRYDDYLEEYARTRFRMQRPGEQVYIME